MRNNKIYNNNEIVNERRGERERKRERMKKIASMRIPDLDLQFVDVNDIYMRPRMEQRYIPLYSKYTRND